MTHVMSKGHRASRSHSEVQMTLKEIILLEQSRICVCIFEAAATKEILSLHVVCGNSQN